MLNSDYEIYYTEAQAQRVSAEYQKIKYHSNEEYRRKRLQLDARSAIKAGRRPSKATKTPEELQIEFINRSLVVI